jgi:hypothetical protein
MTTHIVILKRSVPVIREAYNIGEDGTTGVSKFLQFFQYAAYLMIVTRFLFHFNSTCVYTLISSTFIASYVFKDRHNKNKTKQNLLWH